MSQELFPYEVVGNAPIAHNFKSYFAGDKLELPKHVAENFRWQLKPLSDEGKFDEPVEAGDPLRMQAGIRDHEKVEVLEKRKADLEAQVEKVTAEIERINASAKKTPAKKPATESSAKTAQKDVESKG